MEDGGLLYSILSDSRVQDQKRFVRSPGIAFPVTRRIFSSSCIRSVLV